MIKSLDTEKKKVEVIRRIINVLIMLIGYNIIRKSTRLCHLP